MTWPRLLAGVDAGASKIRVAVGPSPDDIVARDTDRAVRLAEDPGALAAAIRAALGRALAGAGASPPVHAVVVGAAGAAHTERAAMLRDALASASIASRLSVVTDVELVLADAFSTGPGVALIAGTGSIAMGRSPRGEVARAGGQGPELGDPGSGVALGREAVAEALDRPDGPLGRLVLAALALADRAALAAWAKDATPRAVAELAQPVLKAAGSGVQPATMLAERAAVDLATQAAVVLTQLQIPDAEVVFAGGLFADSWFRDRVARAIRQRAPAARVRPDNADGARGALELARQLG